MSNLSKKEAKKIYEFLNILDKYNFDDLYNNKLQIPCDNNELNKIIYEIYNDKILLQDTRNKLINFARKNEFASYQTESDGFTEYTHKLNNPIKFTMNNTDEYYYSITYVLILVKVWNVIKNSDEKKQMLNNLFNNLTLVSFDRYVKNLMIVIYGNNSSCILL
jgi:hypothetical protein